MSAKPVAPDPDHGRCAYELLGQRCTLRGVFAPPGGGHWYCREHWPKARSADSTPPPGGFQVLREIIEAHGPQRPKKLDLESEAERLAIQNEGR